MLKTDQLFNSNYMINPASKMMMLIKHRYIEMFDEGTMWNYPETTTCIEYWVDRINDPRWRDIIEPLHFCEYGDCILIRYKDLKIDWNKYDGLYMECRSVVLNIWNCKPVIVPFRKFFNINEIDETSEANIREKINKAKTVEFSNKLDGSMFCVRYIRHDYVVMSTSMSLNPTNSFRLRDASNMFWHNQSYIKMCKKYPQHTFIFEYISKKDRHVVNYDFEDLVLVGMRNSDTMEEMPYKDVVDVGMQFCVPTTTTFNTNIDDVINSLDEKSCVEAEGFVLNIDGYKVKIKYNDYVRIHKIISGSSTKRIIEGIYNGNYDDMISKIPKECRGEIDKISNNVWEFIFKMKNELHSMYSNHNQMEIKEYMQWVDKCPKIYRSNLRNLYLGKKVDILKQGRIKYTEVIEWLNSL